MRLAHSRSSLPEAVDDPTAVKQAVLVANTNLERVSDWLTTLLLGATLVQIQPLAVWVSNLGTCFKKAKGDPAVKAEAKAGLAGNDFQGLDANVRGDIENELK